MIGIDTNILVRYLTEDDQIQSPKAIKLIEKYSGKNGAILINNIVICELVWVLEQGYKYPKDQIIMVLKSILTTIEFSFENSQMLWASVMEYTESSADFSDILIGYLNIDNQCSKTFTFDKKASILQTVSILE